MRNYTFLLLFLSASLSALITSCKKDKIVQDVGSLSFSVDTVMFDTVFTQRGTATRNFKVYNESNKTLRISSIRFGSANSPFRMNVDGMSGKSFTDVEILPNDSMYVFVEATIDPNGGNSPMVVTDSIVFEFENGVKDVDLVAWGQDANYIFPEPGKGYFILEPQAVWTKDKPYVVYGYAAVDEGNSLKIEAGTRVYFHASSGLWISPGGKLEVKGTEENRVIFQGDRLEPAYKDLPGQWDRIWINEGSVDNVIEYAIIKNGLIGLQVEALAIENPAPPVSSNKLKLSNAIIQNNSALGLYIRNYKVDATNVVVSNAGQYSVGITGGGEFNFKHVTVANNYAYSNRTTPAFYITNAYVTDNVTYVRSITNSSFTNCIFTGSIETEFDLTNVEQGLNFTVSNSLLKRKGALSGNNFTNLIYNQDPGFKDVSALDFHLNNGSVAINKGIFVNVPLDLDQKARDSNPDLGAYEFQP